MKFMYNTKLLLTGSVVMLALATHLGPSAIAQDGELVQRGRGMPGQFQGQGNGPPRAFRSQQAGDRAGPRQANRAAMAECIGNSDEMMYGSTGPQARRTSLQARFDTLDINDDGYLDQEELLATPRERIADTFARLDTNGDGLLSREELDAARTLQIERREEVRRCIEEQRKSAAAGSD